jgi:SAM-dependent methyltransferase
MSRQVLDGHRTLWREKPVLSLVYAPWFEALLIAQRSNGRVLELGAGPGFLAEYARAMRPHIRWVASDLIAAPWNDLAAEAGHLPFATQSLDGIVALDMLHHVSDARSLFLEAARTLRDGAALLALEPWVTPLSYPIYRFLHQEGCRLSLDAWAPFPKGGNKEPFEGDAAVPWRLVRDTPGAVWQELGFSSPVVQPINAFAYLLTLGFRKRSLLPLAFAPALIRVDRALQTFAPILGMRVALRWTRKRSQREVRA